MIRDYVEEIVKIIRSTDDADKLKDLLSDYHEKDIAEAITMLTEQERVKLYDMLNIQPPKAGGLSSLPGKTV